MKSKHLDSLILFLLVMARVRIDTLADLVLPTRQQDVLRLPLTSRLFSPHALDLLQDWLTDPISLVLISLSFAGLLAYVLVGLAERRLGERWTYRLKLGLILLIVGFTIFGNTAKLIALRQGSGPASYCHDGGVIQTEEADKLFLKGRNPYVEDYTQTPLAKWGIDFRSAVYHYPYLPWTFVFSAPFQALATTWWGWFDQRLVYLLLFLAMLLLLPRLAGAPRSRLLLVMVAGLNPIMGSDVLFGQNDSFVLFWLVLALSLLPLRPAERNQNWRYLASSAAAGLACASKPTIWFLMPFYLIHLLELAWMRRPAAPTLWQRLSRLLPLALMLAALVGPYLVWNAPALIDDVWSWASGHSATPYQIRGWGFSILVLALGLVESRLSYFPFWIPELLASLPVLAALAWSQVRRPACLRAGAARVALYGGILLLVYAFFSRFLNENYVGFIGSLLAIGVLAGPADGAEQEGALSE